MVQSAQQTVTAQELSDRLGGKKQGKGFLAHCPCHDDQHASLSIADGDNGTICCTATPGANTRTSAMRWVSRRGGQRMGSAWETSTHTRMGRAHSATTCGATT